MLPTAGEFDPDDNYAGHADADSGDDDELSAEALIWQLLLLINPDDEDAARQQFEAWQELIESAEPSREEVLSALRAVTDWRSCFFADQLDAAGLIECIDELAARWNLRIDWGFDDSVEENALAEMEIPTLIRHAHDELREHGYTLWTWQPQELSSESVYAGWITQRHEDEAVEAVAAALGFDTRPAGAL